MANFKLNTLVKIKQVRLMIAVVCGISIVLVTIVALLMDAKPKKSARATADVDVTGIVDESFTEGANDSALINQQAELISLKKQMSKLAKTLHELRDERAQQAALVAVQTPPQSNVVSVPVPASNAPSVGTPPEALGRNTQAEYWHSDDSTRQRDARLIEAHQQAMSRAPIHTVSFRQKHTIKKTNYLNPAHYVPSNTSVRAIILGGADADASVNGQSKNNGVMLFKFLEDGTLPNGQHSHLRGCRVSGFSYGDISSERAFAALYRISCAHPGKPIIDREVTGWVFFNGKVGIKGQPLMRDNKVMQWAGMSGALSGIAQAAQYAQSVQQFSSFGVSTAVPSSNIAPYAGYGGASKAADVLSQYYVKRAEQYHPVIQVGSGNVVTIVFKDGFYLEPDEGMQQHVDDRLFKNAAPQGYPNQNVSPENTNFTVPPEVLGRIDRVNSQQRYPEGVSP